MLSAVNIKYMPAIMSYFFFLRITFIFKKVDVTTSHLPQLKNNQLGWKWQVALVA